jgi:Bromodomain
VFETPVLETYPELRREYKAKVRKPMDFLTIELKNLPRYGSIAELQRDLRLVYENCCAFNGVESAVGVFAT